MIEDIDDESINDMHDNPSKIKPLFNPYQNLHEKPSSTQQLQLEDTRDCRICLQGNESQQNILVSPCRCTGSVKYLHDKCFRRWVDSIFQHRNKRQQVWLMQNGIQCEICKAKISLTFSNDYSFCQPKPFCRKFKDNPVAFMLFVAVSLLILGSLLLLGVKVGRGDINIGQDLVASVIVIFALIFLSVSQVAILYYCTVDYLVEKHWVLDSYREKKSCVETRNVQIIPMDMQ